MELTETDYKNLNQVLIGLAAGKLDTVPEILDGWQKMPLAGTPKDLLYQLYENILLENKLCKIKQDWNKNAVIGGWKSLELATSGLELIRQNIGVEDYLRSLSSFKDNLIQPQKQSNAKLWRKIAKLWRVSIEPALKISSIILTILTSLVALKTCT